jgi:CDP-diacylglycerol--glycerol-3-phosphate 3-phosphatidyltransferase
MTPAAMTFLGLALVLVGSVMIARGLFVSGGWVIAVGSMLDGLDGAVARASGRVSAKGAFLDAAFDRVGEVAAFAGLAFATAGEARLLLLIVIATGGAMLVPYMRAKAEAAGVPGLGGLMGRSERLILFCSGVILGFVEVMLWIFVFTVWFTAFTRFIRTYRSIE